MEIKDLHDALEEYGLSDKEARVYLAILMLGSSKVSEIAKKANLLRETTYTILKLLEEKGLAGYVIKSGVKYFSVSPPEKLIEILDEKKRKIERIKKELEELQQTAISKPVIEFYEGEEGYKTAAEDMIKKRNKTIYSYLNTHFLKFIPFYHLNFRLRRIKKMIFLKAITERSKDSEELRKLDKKELRKTKFLDGLTNNLNSCLYIYEDKILILKATEQEQFGIIIQDKDLAELQKRIYDILWGLSK